MHPEVKRLRSVIREMLPMIEAEKKHLLESYCICDDDGKPKLETLDDPIAIKLIAGYDKLIEKGRAVLALRS